MQQFRNILGPATTVVTRIRYGSAMKKSKSGTMENVVGCTQSRAEPACFPRFWFCVQGRTTSRSVVALSSAFVRRR